MHDHGPGGVIAAIVTPVTEDGTPDAARFLRHARWLLANGADGLNVLGTTGEATSFSADQRRNLMTEIAKELDPSRLMVGTGCPDLATTTELTRHAHDLGFGAALVLPPYYYKGVGDDGLYSYFASLVEATADRPIPILLYNFPQMTGIRFSPALAQRLSSDFPGRIVGAKDSSGDLDYAAELAKIDGFAVYPSDETALALAPEKGFAGCISATVNLSAPLAARLWRDPSDTALREAVRSSRAAISAAPLIPAVKQFVARLHGDTAFARVLPPLAPLSQAEIDQLTALPAAS